MPIENYETFIYYTDVFLFVIALATICIIIWNYSAIQLLRYSFKKYPDLFIAKSLREYYFTLWNWHERFIDGMTLLGQFITPSYSEDKKFMKYINMGQISLISLIIIMILLRYLIETI